MNQNDPHIILSAKAKSKVILGIALMWLYSLIFAFAMPVVLPRIMSDYGMSAYIAMIGGVSALIGCIVTLIGGKLGDRFGRRKVTMIAGLIRLILFVLCAIPSNGIIFIALYLSSNLIGGLLNAFPVAMLSEVTSAEERPRWFGIFGTLNGASIIIGQLLGGVIADWLGPLAVFLFIVPIGLASKVLIAKYFPDEESKEDFDIDKGGILLLSLGLGSIIAWSSFGGTYFPRVSVLGISLLVFGVLFIAGLLFYEKKVKSPLLKLDLFKLKPFTMSFAAHLLIAPMTGLTASVLPLYGQFTLGLSSTVTGTLALPKNILFFLLPTVLGVWIAKDQRRFRTIFLTCGFAIALGSLLASRWTTNTSILTIYSVMIIFGIGTSSQTVTIQPYMQTAVSPQDTGTASSMVLFANSTGSVLFSSVNNLIYNSRYAAAVAAGGGEHIAQAVTDTFTGVAWLSFICGIAIVVLTIILVPKEISSLYYDAID